LFKECKSIEYQYSIFKINRPLYKRGEIIMNKKIFYESGENLDIAGTLGGPLVEIALTHFNEIEQVK
jgi:hypothetical protein